MGLYLRKYVKVGPVRFNLSKSGVGISAGVRGLRVGGGPRGNYVHMGRHGIYYRATLPQGTRRSKPRPESDLPVAPTGSDAPRLEEIESADAAQIVDSSSAELLNELNTKRRKLRFWPISAGGFALAMLVGVGNAWPSAALWAVAVVGLLGTFAAYYRDRLVKTVVLLYEFDDEMEEAYRRLHKAGEDLAVCAKTWHIEAKGAVKDRKYHAGADTVVQRKQTTIRKAEPPYVKTNIETIAVGVGKQTLHFFPDWVLVYEPGAVGAVSYENLVIEVEQSRFIEEEGVPRDAKVVDRTWRYVNKKGGPDRRFRDNPELPVCLYDVLRFSSDTGLNEVLQVSRCNVGGDLAVAVSNLGKKLSTAAAT